MAATLAGRLIFLWQQRKWDETANPPTLLWGKLALKRSQAALPHGNASELALDFLALQQKKDGSWGGDLSAENNDGDVVVTALAVLAFLSCGHTEKVGKHKTAVKSGVAWLISKQNCDGSIFLKDDGWGTGFLSHATAGIALSEAAGMGRLPETRAAAQKAVNWTSSFGVLGESSGTDQEPDGGKFGAAPAHLLPTTLIVMQLKSTKVNGLDVPAGTFDQVVRFVEACENKNAGTNRFGWTPGEKVSPEATICGCLVRQFSGSPKEELTAAVEWASKQLLKDQAQQECRLWLQYVGTIATFQQKYGRRGTKI